MSALAGCAALTNPVANGIPVRRLPPELLAVSKEGKIPIALVLLGQERPPVYRLGPGDVLSVYVEGVLGNPNEPIPLYSSDSANLPPAPGFPLPVREDGTLPLPLVAPVRVAGLTVEEAERAVRAAYVQPPTILKPGLERVLVTLLRPRSQRILVVREDRGPTNVELKREGILRSTRALRGGVQPLIDVNESGTGVVLDLPAYENDVLNALLRSGGLPGPNAAPEVIIERRLYRSTPQSSLPPQGAGSYMVRIPMRICPGQPLPFSPSDVVLHSGDVVYVRAREPELFYTAGYLPPGEFALPRDYDLDVVEAIALVGGTLNNGGVAIDNLEGQIVAPGIGTPSPTLLTVLRRTPDGRQVPIQVDLAEALRDRREALLVQAGDVLVLQEQVDEALTRYVLNDVLSLRIFSDVIRTSRTVGTVGATGP
ncbi:MAG: polysaccharide biosynthesis/export family protein [Pirellulales bacterium]|nr:polysaccharide biosynthesis/export family protein [Pirellulales bacterium]